MPTKEDVSRQFGRNAGAYATSKGHAQGTDLNILLSLLNPKRDWKVLDVATGAGHTAIHVAPYVNSVVATDLTPEMIAETEKLMAARGITNATAQVMDVEALGFADAGFDAVTCRIAPHHFIDINKALREIARVLPSSGVFVVEDSFAPQAARLDKWINDLERLRDATHVRSYTKAQWRTMLNHAGFRVLKSRNYRKRHNIAEWMDNAGLGEEGQQAVIGVFRLAPTWARKHYEIEYDGADPIAYTDDKVLFHAVKN